MAIAYPLAMPASPGFVEMNWDPATVVGYHESPTTKQGQTFVWPGQAWAFTAPLPRMRGVTAAAWIAWKLALNGRQGTFFAGDISRPTSLGNPAGAWAVDAGAVFLSTTLPITGGTGAFVVGDWLQVGNYLHNVIKVNAGSVDVWPRLRAAYAAATLITYVNAKGLFRLADNQMEWNISTAKHTGLELRAVEAL